MLRIRVTAPAALLVAVPVLLAGCGSSNGSQHDSPAPTTSVSSSTAGPVEEARQAAIQTVTDYAQMVTVDLFSGRATLNDLTDVTAGKQLAGQQKYSQGVLAQGWTAKADQAPEMVSIKVVSASPKADPTKVVVRYCTDATGVQYTREVNGKKQTEHGLREGADKTVEKTARGWRITSSSDMKRC